MNALDSVVNKLERFVRDGELAQKSLLRRIKDRIT